MPELPEVEVTRRGLLEQLPGRMVTAVSWSAHRLRGPIPHRLLLEEIEGRQIRTVDRRAKYLLVRMAGGAVLVIHLGMTGKLGVIQRQTAPHKHDHLLLELDNGMDVRFNDSRRFGVILVWPAEQAARCEETFSLKEGLEPFGDDFTAKQLHALAQHRRVPVKALLMNSRLIAGIGNIYANEILFAAGIHPLMPANQLTTAAWGRVVKQARRILQRAIDAGGSTISDFLGASGHPGYFQLQLAVYGRKDLPCPRCGQPIVKTTLAGRATFHCPACQPG